MVKSAFWIIFVIVIGIAIFSDKAILKDRTVDDERLQGEKIVFTHIIRWKDLLSMFEDIEPDNNDQIFLLFPGVKARAVVCSPASSCPHVNVSFQPPSLVAIGGICGIDFSPVVYGGLKARLFLLPQMKGERGEYASEGSRGVIASSTGYVFDIAGGCEACITILPRVGQEIYVNEHSLRAAPVVIAGLHGHSGTYFHTVHELFPRLYMIMDYVHKNFETSNPKNLVVNIRSNYELLNSLATMMGWGLKPTTKAGINHKYSGSFIQVGPHTYIEATQNLVSPLPIQQVLTYNLFYFSPY